MRECVEDLRLHVPFIGTADNLADFFTKSLPARVFVPMRDRIMGNDPAAEHGGVLSGDDREVTSSLRELGDVAHVWPQALLSHF